MAECDLIKRKLIRLVKYYKLNLDTDPEYMLISELAKKLESAITFGGIDPDEVIVSILSQVYENCTRPVEEDSYTSVEKNKCPLSNQQNMIDYGILMNEETIGVVESEEE